MIRTQCNVEVIVHGVLVHVHQGHDPVGVEHLHDVPDRREVRRVDLPGPRVHGIPEHPQAHHVEPPALQAERIVGGQRRAAVGRPVQPRVERRHLPHGVHAMKEPGPLLCVDEEPCLHGRMGRRDGPIFVAKLNI